MFDGNMAARVIEHTLTEDSTLMALIEGVVEDIWGKDENAPASAFPFIRFSIMTQSDEYYNGQAKALTNQPVLIHGVQMFDSNGSYGGTLQTIADRIDTLLHGKTLTIYDTDDITAIGRAYIYRESPFRERFIDGSIEYRYLGGIYQVSINEN